jgi:hypothetical protein
MSAGQKVPQDAKKEEFRKYLEKAGVLELLTKSLVQLYEVSYNAFTPASVQNSACFQLISGSEFIMLPVDHSFRVHNATSQSSVQNANASSLSSFRTLNDSLSIIRSEFSVLPVDHLFRTYNASIRSSVQNS